MKRKPMRMTQILVGLVAAIVAVTLAVWVTLYLHQYRAAAIQNAGTSSAQAVSQVAGTVGNYMEELGETMALGGDQVQGKEEDRRSFSPPFCASARRSSPSPAMMSRAIWWTAVR